MLKSFYPLVRYVFGIGMAFFGLNNLFHFLPAHAFEGVAGEVMSAFENSGYIIPVVGITQLILSVSLLLDRYVPFALLLFVPIVVNILLFHLFLDLSGIFMSLPVIGVTVYLVIRHQATFFHLLKSDHEKI